MAARLIAAFLILLSACAAEQSEPAAPLAPGSYVLREMKGTVMPQDTIRLELDGARMTGTAGCNSFGASYLIEGEALEIGAIALTKRYCMDRKVMAREEVFIRALGSASSVRREAGTVVIETAEGPLVFTAVAQP